MAVFQYSLKSPLASDMLTIWLIVGRQTVCL